jgi:hypothetical protein
VNRKLPIDAFQHYLALGPARSYQAVADHFQVSKQAVTGLAKRERWQQRARELEQKTLERAEKKVGETLEQMTERHIKMLHTIAVRALDTLKKMPLETAAQAVRALDTVITQERAIRSERGGGEPNLEVLIRTEYQRWMKPADPDESRSSTD